MNSRIEPKIRAVLKTRRKFSKYALAEATPCHQRTAQRVLTRLHQQGEIHIVAWVSIYHAPIPQYVIGPGKDAPRPRPQTKAETARMYRGPAPEIDTAKVFGITTFELG